MSVRDTETIVEQVIGSRPVDGVVDWGVKEGKREKGAREVQICGIYGHRMIERSNRNRSGDVQSYMCAKEGCPGFFCRVLAT